MISDGARHEVAVTMAAFRYYYEESLQNKEYGKPDCVADLLCKRLRKIMEEKVTPAKRKRGAKPFKAEDGAIDDESLLQMYHEGIVKDILRTVQRGAVDFVYDPMILLELYEYDQDIAFKWKNDTFYVWTEGVLEA